MEIRQIETGKIIPYEKNAKKHSQKQIAQVANSIKRFGWAQPLVIDKYGNLIIGHARLEAAKSLGMDKVPTVKMENLTEDEVKALRLADNKLNESEWDMGLAVEELKGLSDEMLDLTGFDKDLLIEPDERDDEVPATPEAPQSLIGDLYELGRHRVLCGDSTQPDAVLRLMDGKRADMVFTSPPYNVGHNLGYKKRSKYASSDDDLEEYRKLLVDSTKLALLNARDVFINLQFLANNKRDLVMYLAELVENFKDIFFWKKLQVAPAMARNVANSQTETILLFGEESEEERKEWIESIVLLGMNQTRRWGNKPFRGSFSNFVETKSASGENKNAEIHNATFPVELAVKFITKGYIENSIILDNFIGTGSTLIAAEKTGRICYGMELDCKYTDVIIERWCQFTGIRDIIKNGERYRWEAK